MQTGQVSITLPDGTLIEPVTKKKNLGMGWRGLLWIGMGLNGLVLVGKCWYGLV